MLVRRGGAAGSSRRSSTGTPSGWSACSMAVDEGAAVERDAAAHGVHARMRREHPHRQRQVEHDLRRPAPRPRDARVAVLAVVSGHVLAVDGQRRALAPPGDAQGERPLARRRLLDLDRDRPSQG